jgi:hypothetical protein
MSHPIPQHLPAHDSEQQTAQAIIQVLDQSTQQIPPNTLRKLAAARQHALTHYPETPTWVPAWAGQWLTYSAGRRSHSFRYALPMVVLIFGLLGLTYWQTTTSLSNEIADIDSRLLTDELPIDAYLDKGFDSWLKRQSN